MSVAAPVSTTTTVSGSTQAASPSSPPPCDEELRVPTELVQDCVEGRCTVELPITIANCGDAPFTIARVEIVQPENEESVSGILLTVEFSEPTLMPGETRSRSVGLSREGAVDILVHRSDAEPLSASVMVRNPARTTAMEACAECDGEWGPAGMRGVEACNCRTRDAGETCRSSAECEGVCLFRGSVRIADSPPDQPACTRWVMEGACSGRSLVFGCRPYLRRPTYSCSRPARGPYACVD